ncbi:MAG TPA: crossover junction endodeoxyribonuclease RuvC [Bacteroidales bacterium]|nr:MAG: crossover junction endodeoxyribonuclease RuvC [Bacteroidetes bacterium GWF2_33_38]OFY75124.1 MAG: crossover junction endodeoxyribonuclease RuvC [Bacteroidetes bacterium RIFOXYA12_FULL_33_9]OFY88119.1 MAG: crossover junction endodeoxyribonuclease RuvC [Bacteroidetes bacterium RIFOXYA2_FULL_33_7]HBF89318.1 crossover junction endodeoxyribonuclease RuvC [Bacteroidales bacterium]
MVLDRIILGIDPGTCIMGYGIIHVINNKPKLLSMGHIEINKFSDPYLKLKYIYDRTLSLIIQYTPDELAIEAPFYGKNVQSMLKLGRAQGAAISAALSRNLPIFEYAPKKIKMAITGNGNASKEQVAMILKNLLKLDALPTKLDATDGLAAAFCHFYQNNALSSTGKSYSGWADFAKKNNDRIK